MRSLYLGIDTGGTKTAYGLFDEDMNLVAQHQEPTPIDADGPTLADMLIESACAMLRREGVSQSDIKRAAICMPSFIIYDRGYIYMTSAMVNLRDFAMRDYLAERLDFPVILDNDSNAAALAEYRYGAGRGSRHMVYMSASTGLGSGLILNGELFRGSYGWAGETGHMLITPDEGVLCGCRNRGCFMSMAAGRYVPEQIRRIARGRETIMDLGPKLDCVELNRACRLGDPVALECLDHVAHYYALCLFNIYQILNVNLFVFGGGMVNFGPMLFDRVRAEFDRYNHVPLPVEFRMAELKKNFGIIGAAELARCDGR